MIDFTIMLINRRLRETYKWETIVRHEERIQSAIEKRKAEAGVKG